MGMQKMIRIDVNTAQPLWPYDVVNEIEKVMEEGELVHPHGSWEGIEAQKHVHHAIDHLHDYFKAKQTEDDLTHAFTRIMMAVALEKGYVKPKQQQGEGE